MARFCILLAVLFAGGLAFPTEDAVSIFDGDMAEFFDHTVSDAEGRIVGGSVAPEGAYPWMVAMTNGNNRAFLCGGAVVTNRRVISAAHCIVAAAPGNQLSRTLRVTVGTNRWNSGGQTYQLTRHHNHPHYNPGTLKHDIGVLVTSSNVATNTRVRFLPISYAFIGGNAPVRVSGWGNIRQGGPLSAQLLELRLNTFDGNRCRTDVARMAQQINMRAPAVDPNLEICTFLAQGRGTCNGDSGSPLVLNSNNHLVGVVSWGLPCARGAPDMYARVSAFHNWLPGALR